MLPVYPGQLATRIPRRKGFLVLYHHYRVHKRLRRRGLAKVGSDLRLSGVSQAIHLNESANLAHRSFQLNRTPIETQVPSKASAPQLLNRIPKPP